MPEAVKYEAKFQGGQTAQTAQSTGGAKAFASDYSGGQKTYDKVLKDFELENVKLSTGEYVPKSEFDALSPDDQKLLMEKGITEFSAIKKIDYEKFIAENIKLSNGDYIPKSLYDSLHPDRQKLLMELGVEAYNALPRPVVTYEQLNASGLDLNAIMKNTEDWEAFQKAYPGYALPYPPNVNPWRHYGDFYWWTNEQLEAVFGAPPTKDDPRYYWEGQYGSGGVTPIPPYLQDMSQVAKYLYGDVGKGERGVLSPISENTETVIGVDEEGNIVIGTATRPGSIPGFDVYGHAIPGFPPSGVGVRYDTVINGVPYYHGVPVVNVDPKYLDPNYSPYPVKAEVQPIPLDTVGIPVGEAYLPGSTMYELGYRNEGEYRQSPNQPPRLPKTAYEREKLATRDFLGTGSEETEPSGVVIGTSPTTNEVLVKLADGGTVWKPATAEQLAEATIVLNAGGEYGKEYVIPTDKTRGIAPGFTLMSPEEQVADYNQKLDAFKAKWADYTASGKFKGTKAEYGEYLDEIKNIQGLYVNVKGTLAATNTLLSETGANLQTVQNEAQQKALAKMEAYKTQDGGYRLEDYLLSGTTANDGELKQAGFSDEQIAEARKAAELAYAPRPDYDLFKAQYKGFNVDADYKRAVDEWTNYNREQKQLKAIFEAERSPEYVKAGGGTGLGAQTVIYNPMEGYLKVRNLDLGWAFDESGKIINASIKRVFTPTEYKPSELYESNIGSIGGVQAVGGASGLAVGTSALAAGSVVYNKLQSGLPEASVKEVEYTPFSVGQYPAFKEKLDINPPAIPQEMLDVNPPDIPQEKFDINPPDIPQEKFDVGNLPDTTPPPMEKVAKQIKPTIIDAVRTVVQEPTSGFTNVSDLLQAQNTNYENWLNTYSDTAPSDKVRKIEGLRDENLRQLQNRLIDDIPLNNAKIDEGMALVYDDFYRKWQTMSQSELDADKSHQDYLSYLKKKALLKQAWKSFLGSPEISPAPDDITHPNIFTVFQTAVMQGVNAYLDAKIQGATDIEAKTATQTAVQTVIQPVSDVLTDTETATLTETATQTAVQTATQVQTVTNVQTLERENINEAELTDVRELTDTQEMTDTMTDVAVITPALAIPAINPEEQSGKVKRGVPPGTIEWRQGKKWVALYPPYTDNDKEYLDYPLQGTYKFAVGKGSAMKTLQVLGGAPEKDADIDMGWAQVHISSKGKELQMSFGGGEQAANDRWTEERQKMEAYERLAYAFDSLPKYSTLEKIPRMRKPRQTTYVPEETPDYTEQEIEQMRAKLAQYEAQAKPKQEVAIAPVKGEKPFERRYLGYKLRPTPISMDL